MSLPFNDTSTLKGLVQIYEKEIGAEQGEVSGSTTKLKAFTADANLAFDDLINIALEADGTWQFDDTNQSDYPERTMTLTSGTRRYAISAFTADAGANLPLEIHKVFIKNPLSAYVEIYPVDVQSQSGTESFTDGLNTSGTPYRYDKTGGFIDLDPVPNYTISQGIKILVTREPAYFTSSDTTKKPGIPGSLHKYLALKPAFDYARRHNLPNKQDLMLEVLKMEQIIADTYSSRNADEKPTLQARVFNFR